MYSSNYNMISPCNTNYNNDFFIQNKIVDDEIPGILKLFGVSFVESKYPPTIDSISSVTYSDNINGFCYLDQLCKLKSNYI